MVDKKTMDSIQKQFEANPTQIQTNLEFAYKYTITRILSDVDVSINALSAVIGPNDSQKDLADLKTAWDIFLPNAKLPD